MTIGDRFRETREEKNISIREVQDNLKIRTRYLEALENNNFDIIPGEAYVKAFIKSYANFLELNHFELIEEYMKIKEEELRKIEEENEEKNNTSNNFMHNKATIALVILFILVILAVLIYNILLLNNSSDVSVNSNQLQEKSTISDNSINNSYSDNNFLVNNRNNENEVIINKEYNEEISNETLVNETNEISYTNDQLNNENFNENNLSNYNYMENKEMEYKSIDIIVSEMTWLQVLVDDNNVFEGTLYKGDLQSFSYLDNISMKIGNAAGIQVRKNNQLLGPWGEQGEVIKKIID